MKLGSLAGLAICTSNSHPPRVQVAANHQGTMCGVDALSACTRWTVSNLKLRKTITKQKKRNMTSATRNPSTHGRCRSDDFIKTRSHWHGHAMMEGSQSIQPVMLLHKEKPRQTYPVIGLHANRDRRQEERRGMSVAFGLVNGVKQLVVIRRAPASSRRDEALVT